MRNLCPFTKSICDKEACALWLKHLKVCSFKEIVIQINDLKKEISHLNAIIGSIPHKIKIKT